MFISQPLATEEGKFLAWMLIVGERERERDKEKERVRERDSKTNGSQRNLHGAQLYISEHHLAICSYQFNWILILPVILFPN